MALLLGALGFAAAVQVRTTQAEGALAAARTEDLVIVLDDLSTRNERLRAEVAQLTAARERLRAGGGPAALAEARRRTQLLGVLAGTVPAAGPGVVLTVQDPAGAVSARTLLDALEELRGAGAEALQIEGTPVDGGAGAVRVVASTSLLDDRAGAGRGGVLIDGVRLRPPYRFVVVGDTGTLTSALGIPGGVLDTVERDGGSATVSGSARLRVAALRPLAAPRYARPVPGS